MSESKRDYDHRNWKQEKLDVVKDIRTILVTYLTILNDISKGTSETKACRDMGISVSEFRKIYKTKVIGYEAPQMPDLDLPDTFMVPLVTNYPLLSWQETLWLAVTGEHDIRRIPPDVEESIDYVLAIDKILSTREYAVIFYRFHDRLTLEETGKIYDITRDRVRQIESKALRKLRSPKIYRILKYGVGWYRKFEEVRSDTYQSQNKEDFERLQKELEEAIINKDRDQVLRIFNTSKDILEKGFKIDVQHLSDGQHYYPLDTDVSDMELSVRSHNCLKRAGINTLEDILKVPIDEMWKIRNLGRRSSEEVIAKVKKMGYQMFETREALEEYQRQKEGTGNNDAV